MTADIRLRIAKARRLIRIARTYDAAKDPDGVAHHAYYAMYNAAWAVFLAQGSEHPKTHSTLVGRFGLLVKNMPAKARDHGRALREAFRRGFLPTTTQTRQA